MPQPADKANPASVLQGCSLFQPLGRQELEVLGRRAYRQSYRAGERIFGFGDPGESMMIILVGTIRISRPTAHDKELILSDLESGDILGEMAVLDGKPRSAEARAITNCAVLVLERRDLLPFLEAHPSVCLTLLGVLCGKIRLADERTADVGFAALSTRLAKTLLRRLPPNRSKISLSQSELADMVGATRESVNRQLRAWEDQGMIELREGWIIIADRTALAARSNSGL